MRDPRWRMNQHSARRQKQIIQHRDAQTHNISNNGVSIALRLLVITQESCELLTVSRV